MIRKRSVPPERISFHSTCVPNSIRKTRLLCIHRSQNATSVRTERLAIRFQNKFKQRRRHRFPIFCLRSAPQIGVRAFQRPPLQFVLCRKSQLLVNRFSLRRRIQLYTRHSQRIQVLNAPLQQPRSNSAPAILRINQHHSHPRKSPTVHNRRCRSPYHSIQLHDKRSLHVSFQKSHPVRARLVPSRQFLQPHAARNVRLRHHPHFHRKLLSADPLVRDVAPRTKI